MKTSYYILLLSITACILSCGPATKMLVSYEAPDVQPRKFENIAVLSILPSMDARATVEQAVAGKMQEEGINGKATFTIFTFAGNQEVMAELDLSQEELREIARKKVTENKIDGLLTIALLDAQQEEHYVEGSSFGVSVGFSGYPTYAYNYYDYYAYAYSAVYSQPGYFVNSTTYFLESNFYDTSTGKLIWTAQTSTKDQTSVTKGSADFADLIVTEMLRKKIIEK